MTNEMQLLINETARLRLLVERLQNNIEGNEEHIKSLEEAFDKIEKYNWQLIAEREAMMKQEPVGYLCLHSGDYEFSTAPEDGVTCRAVYFNSPPAQQIPEGYAKIPAKKPLPDLMLASFHKAQGWNSCVDFMLSASQPKGDV